MSRGRPRHQASRRRVYSTRQRELRERRTRILSDDSHWLTDAVAYEIDESLEFEAPTSWSVRLHGRPSAA
jgi:hypothetical protein